MRIDESIRLNVGFFLQGDRVIVEPLPEDVIQHRFIAHVAIVRPPDKLIQVIDEDGDTFDCCPEQLFILDDE